MARKKVTEHYSAENITSLTDVEHLKKKINLTFGRETGDAEHPYSLQKTVSIREIIDNSVGEIIRNFADRIEVTFDNDGFVTVLDNGRGLPIDTATDALGNEVNGFIITLGTLRSGENLGSNSSGGKSTSQNGLGASAACALSERVDIEVYRNNKIYYMSFKDFVPGYFNDEDEFKPLKNKATLKSRKDDRAEYYKTNFPTGTKIRIKLDDNIFSSPYPVDVDDLNDRLKGVSYLLPKSHIKVIDNFKNNAEYEYYSENGLRDALPEGANVVEFTTSNDYLEKNVAVMTEGAIQHKDLIRTVDIELAFCYADESNIDTYVNTIKTRLKGVHLQAFEDALADAFNSEIKSKDKPNAEDYREGLNLQLSVFIPDPLFSGQTKEELAGKEVKNAIYDAVKAELMKFISTKENSSIVEKITSRAVTMMQARKSIADSKKVAKEKLKSDINGMRNRVENFIDCRSKDSSKKELYIAEGASALGSLKQARNPEYQALFPIRGKIKSVYKTSVTDALSSQLIKNIIQLVGTGVNTKTTKCDLSKLNFDKIIFAHDSDVDGCFSGNTKIKSTDGNIYTFEQLIQDKITSVGVYAKDKNGNIVQAEGVFPRVTKEVNELIELEFENKFKVRCTLDHLFLLDSGEYKAAMCLTTDDLISSESGKCRILNSTIIHLDEPIKVYDITVPEYGSFLISTSNDNTEGVFVHNCHISSLLLTLFYTFMPELIKDGHVYSLQTPLFEIVYKDNTKAFAYDEQEKIKLTKDKDVKKIMRNKGLGEISAEDMALCLNESTQRLVRFTMEDAKHAAKFIELFMGNDSNVRKDYITEHADEYELDFE